MKKLFLAAVVMFFLGLGVWLTLKYYDWRAVNKEEQALVLLEKIKQVYKIIAVEGYFSEIYTYEDYWAYDFSPFRKKALIRVKAKVSAGFDLENMLIESRPDEKKIYISRLPRPEIISIEHDLDYYDISEGTFNSFSREDYNELNASAKAMILAKAEESNLLDGATRQSDEALSMMRYMVENAGWKLVIKRDLVNKSTLDKLF